MPRPPSPPAPPPPFPPPRSLEPSHSQLALTHYVLLLFALSNRYYIGLSSQSQLWMAQNEIFRNTQRVIPASRGGEGKQMWKWEVGSTSGVDLYG